MDLKFLLGEPALLAGKTLVIADLHLGIEYEYWKNGISVPSQTELLKEKIDRLLKKTKAKRLVICGDFKHKVPGTSFQEKREIPLFLDYFSQKIAVDIALGNHDADLPHLVSGQATLQPTTGFRQGKIFFFHGHTWPDDSFLDCEYIICGHVQPQIEITDKMGYRWRQPAWVRAPLDRKALSMYTVPKRLPEIIIVPSFNGLAGGLALNKKEISLHRSPILQMAQLRKARISLLDGTFLGELGSLPASP